MSRNKRRDDKDIDRLSSFLYWEGNFRLKELKPIKNDVLLITSDNLERYILKRHSNKKNITQQWEFFSKINAEMITPFVRFPNGRKIISDENHFYWTLTPFIQGRKLNYISPIDRKTAVQTLRNFHRNASEVFVENRVNKQLFYLRWYNRLQTFKKTEYLFLKFGYENLYKDITKKTEQSIQLVATYPWKLIQRQAEESGIWVHGDVASHNFIQNERTYLIDFDLLLCTSQIYDYIQLGQRFLPYVNWDIDQLLTYRMVEDSDVPIWLMAIAIPSDVLREWLHYLSHQRSDRSIDNYLTEMEKNWMKRKDFVKMAKLVVK
ncbi:phosphotransferase [Ornithinibacillus salinisoli]|uniref:Phosphotransferase n=1 Tax=Ornithinibacillus salinisoli TaxID=1848459 RepID=A0ABW4W4R7_9BACI